MPNKRTLLAIHRWTGIVAALFLLLQGLTGAVAEWRDEALDAAAPAVAPSLARATGGALAVDAMLAAARRAHPKGTVKRMDLPEEGDRPLLMRLAEGGADRLLFFAPGTGALLSDRPARSYPSEFLYELHSQFSAGPHGRYVMALDALALLLLVVTGPWFWWPGRRNVRRALKLRWKGPAHRLVAELHRVSGATLFAFLGLTALTGLALALAPEVKALVGSEAAPKPPKLAASTPLAPLASVLRQAAASFPGQHLRSLRFSGPQGQIVRVIATARGPHSWSIDQMWIDRSGQRLVARQDARNAAPGDSALGWILPLHSWSWAGRVGQVLAMLLGLSLAGFAGSGFWLWARRTIKRRRSGARA